MRSYIKNYLSISKKEWNGLVIFVIVIALILAAPYAFQMLRKDTTINPYDFDKAVATLDKAKKSQAGDYPDNSSEKPNTTPIIYKKAAPGIIIEINTADSAKLTELHGIGPAFARRIISYRDRLGGFYNKEQLREVFGIDAEKYNELQVQVKVDASKIKRININKVNFDGLSHFPYLSYKQMNAIIQFREQHGDYEKLADMKNIAILNDEILRKIEPYLAFK
jgi:competence ComEA-like helix-hairpin-helix protein